MSTAEIKTALHQLVDEMNSRKKINCHDEIGWLKLLLI